MLPATGQNQKWFWLFLCRKNGKRKIKFGWFLDADKIERLAFVLMQNSAY